MLVIKRYNLKKFYVYDEDRKCIVTDPISYEECIYYIEQHKKINNIKQLSIYDFMGA